MKNEYAIRGDVVAIIINSPKYGTKETIINLDKLERAKEFPNTWCLRYDPALNAFYVSGCTYGKKKQTIQLHRWITTAPEGMVIDHYNHDTLDNTDSNIRIITHAGNMQNKREHRKDNKSGIRGVHWYKNYNKWAAQIRVNNKKIHLGYFADIKDAERVVIQARATHMQYSREASTF